MTRFVKRDDKWVVESDAYIKSGSLVKVSTKKGESTVKIGRCIEQPRGVQKRGTYIYEVDR